MIYNYLKFKQVNECHFPEVLEMKKDKLKNADNFPYLVDQYGGDEDRANELFDWFYDILVDLNRGGYIYRIIFLTDLKFFNEDNVGQHWTHSFEKAEELEYKLKQMISPEGDYEIDDYDAYIIEAKILPNNIDFESSMSAFCEYPDEEEINLKQNRSHKPQIEIKSVTKL